jgi:hypothetical protein
VLLALDYLPKGLSPKLLYSTAGSWVDLATAAKTVDGKAVTGLADAVEDHVALETDSALAVTVTDATLAESGNQGERLLSALALQERRIPACRRTTAEMDVGSAESL